MTLVIASQLEEGLNAQLRTHVSAPTVIGVSEERPWEAANDADLLLIRPSLQWRQHKTLARPAVWPGRLKWVYSASVGVDFYPRWVLDAPLVTCGRGVASEEIADYVFAALYSHAKDLDAIRAHQPADWKPTPLGRVAGTTLGIVGLGAIGVAVARRALALGMRVTATRRRRLPSPVAGVELVDTLQAVVASADHLLLALQGFTNGLAVDVRFAIHVAAHPGPEMQNVRNIQGVGGDRIRGRQSGLDFLVKQRDDPVEDFEQVEKHMLAFVGNGESLAGMILRLPDAGDFEAHTRPQRVALGLRERRIQPIQQILRDVLLLAQNGAARGLGGMRHEHRLDAHRGNHVESAAE